MLENEREKVRIGKLISLILRHEPTKIGIAELEPGGFVPVETLLVGLRKLGTDLSREELDQVVRESDKGRYSYDPSGTRIRCNQGHSVPVDLELAPETPPEFLFHGTPEKSVESILRMGLRKMDRHAVHLSPDQETASAVGQRRGQPVILRIRAGKMHAEGHLFYRSTNGVWLVESVPPDHIDRLT